MSRMAVVPPSSSSAMPSRAEARSESGIVGGLERPDALAQPGQQARRRRPADRKPSARSTSFAAGNRLKCAARLWAFPWCRWYTKCKADARNRTASATHSGEAAFSRSCHQRSRPSCQSTFSPVRFTTIDFSIVGQFRSAASAVSFRGTIFPRRKPPSAVMSIFDFASAIRSTSAVALNPPKITECTAPIRAHASMAIGSSGTIGK